ncbi:MAG: helix-turn-helix domain-containing protein [Chloroflexota bacterium]
MELRRIEEVANGKSEGLSGNNELDLPPEYCRYRDEGCELASSCLECPFTRCIYDEPGGKQRWLKRLRAREMLRLFTAEGKGTKELALMFGVSRRTVQRALKKEIPLNEAVRKG